jgi:hypothetical protein
MLPFETPLEGSPQAEDQLQSESQESLSVYGLGRWPISLYRNQWETLFENREMIEAFRTESQSKGAYAMKVVTRKSCR